MLYIFNRRAAIIPVFLGLFSAAIFILITKDNSTPHEHDLEISSEVVQDIIYDLKNNANLILLKKSSSSSLHVAKFTGDSQYLHKFNNNFPIGNFDIFLNEGYDLILYVNYKVKYNFRKTKTNLIRRTKYYPVRNGLIKVKKQSKIYDIPISKLFDGCPSCSAPDE